MLKCGLNVPSHLWSILSSTRTTVYNTTAYSQRKGTKAVTGM